MLFINNKYYSWYIKLVTRGSKRIKTSNMETHHIVPRSLGGTNDKSNLSHLTFREHFLCHVLLTKITHGNSQRKMFSAVTRFQQSANGQQRNLTSRQYAILRECAIKARIGVKHTAEAKKKIQDKHHDVSGSKNPRAKKFRVISPTGAVYYIHGGLKAFCVEHKIAYSNVLRMTSHIDTWRRDVLGSTAGWKFERI